MDYIYEVFKHNGDLSVSEFLKVTARKQHLFV